MFSVAYSAHNALVVKASEHPDPGRTRVWVLLRESLCRLNPHWAQSRVNVRYAQNIFRVVGFTVLKRSGSS